MRRTGRTRVALVAGALALAAACGGGDGGDDGASTANAAAAGGGGGGGSGSGEALRVGYSAWPGWFPLAVAEEAGTFEAEGLEVELTYFADYTASLDAMVAGELDVNAQTLNDTIFAVAAGSPQRIIVVGDNSTGNDAVICDESITSVEDLKGKSVGAEQGVVDHFLLLQGLAEAGLSEDDIQFQGLRTDAAAATFAGGQLDCVAVFAPFTSQALQRPGSHVLFSSADFPGAIPDHFVTTADVVEQRAGDLQRFVDAWYATLDWMEQNPDEATRIMAEKAGLPPEEYAGFAEGTTLFSAQQALDAFADRDGDPTSLPHMARRINPFLVEAGLTEQEADLSGLFDDRFTRAHVEQQGAGG